jgi:hypothetical protein
MDFRGSEGIVGDKCQSGCCVIHLGMYLLHASGWSVRGLCDVVDRGEQLQGLSKSPGVSSKGSTPGSIPDPWGHGPLNVLDSCVWS